MVEHVLIFRPDFQCSSAAPQEALFASCSSARSCSSSRSRSFCGDASPIGPIQLLGLPPKRILNEAEFLCQSDFFSGNRPLKAFPACLKSGSSMPNKRRFSQGQRSRTTNYEFVPSAAGWSAKRPPVAVFFPRILTVCAIDAHGDSVFVKLGLGSAGRRMHTYFFSRVRHRRVADTRTGTANDCLKPLDAGLKKG